MGHNPSARAETKLQVSVSLFFILAHRANDFSQKKGHLVNVEQIVQKVA
jgi:hypothetical protein